MRAPLTASTAATLTLLALALQAQADEAATSPSPQSLDEVVVTATPPGDSTPVTAQSAKSDIPLLETPQAISVVTSESIERRGVTRLAEALRPVAGVTRSSTYGFYDSYQIRGYDAAYGSVYLDGLMSGNVAGANNELAGLEQVEVVKGPASMLYGAAPLGGIVNLVSKRPREDRFTDIGIATGSYGLVETTIDSNSALSPSGNLLGRLNLVYRDSDDFVNFSDKNRIYVAPALTWKVQPGTQLTLLGRYQKDNDSPWSPVTAWGTVRPNANGPLPIDFSINNANTSHDKEEQQIGYIFDHRFSDNVSFNQTLRYTHREVDWDNWMFAAGFLDNNVVNGVQQGRVMGRYLYGPFHEDDQDLGVDTRLTLKFATGGLRHDVLAGIDYRQNRNDSRDTGSNFLNTDNPLDIYAPDYSLPLLHDPLGGYANSDQSRQTGIYLQDHLEIGERVTFTLGGREDKARNTRAEDRKFSPRVGATYLLVPGVSVYASWSESFTPQSGFTFSGDTLPPETGENIEGGLKVAALDGDVSGMLSVFQLTRQNVSTTDPVHPNFSVVTGEQRSRGIELEGKWRPVTPLTLTLAYAHIDAEVTKDNVFTVGSELPNVPKDSINLYGEYIVQSGPLANLGVSVGALYNSKKNGSLSTEDITGDGIADPESLFTLPGYTLFDAGLSYVWGPWRSRLNVNNLFDKRYYPDACCLDRVTPGEPRNWRLSLARTF